MLRTAGAAAFLISMLSGFPSAQTPPLPATAPPDATMPDDPPAELAVVDGTAALERDGQRLSAEENMPLLAGDRLRTESGRLEVLFADGSALDIDRQSSVDLLSESLMRLRAGRVRLSIARVSESLNYRIDGAGASATIGTAGEYRLRLAGTTTGTTLELDVVQGSADLSSPLGRTRVGAGRAALAGEHTEPSLPITFNPSRADEFDRWADDLRDTRLGAQSARYLPSDLRAYGGELDRNGDWQYESSYGYVWYPRVAATWEPYYDGRWSVVGSYGWVWVGLNRWSWPTHHYGRWNVISNRWCWVPGRQWSPAWVSWAVSPGYVSWCPLGFDGRPAVALAGGVRGVGQGHRGWTVVPDRTFAGTAVVPRHVVASQTLAPGALSAFRLDLSGPRAATPRVRTEPLRAPNARRGDRMSDDRVTRTGPSSAPPVMSRPNVTSMPSSRLRGPESAVSVAPPSSPTERRSSPRASTPSRPETPETPSAPRTPSSTGVPGSRRIAPPESAPSVPAPSALRSSPRGSGSTPPPQPPGSAASGRSRSGPGSRSAPPPPPPQTSTGTGRAAGMRRGGGS